MARMNGIEPNQAGFVNRIIYWLARRKVGKLTGNARLIEPLKITAHHPRLLKGFGMMEMAQDSARSIPAPLKVMASVKAAMLVGCPF